MSETPMRFVGWSVDRVDGSSSFGTFDRRETADQWCARIREGGTDVHVVRFEVPDELETLRRERDQARGELDRLHAEVATTTAAHARCDSAAREIVSGWRTGDWRVGVAGDEAIEVLADALVAGAAPADDEQGAADEAWVRHLMTWHSEERARTIVAAFRDSPMGVTHCPAHPTPEAPAPCCSKHLSELCGFATRSGWCCPACPESPSQVAGPAVPKPPRPAYGDPGTRTEGWDDDHDRAIYDSVGWDLAFGCAITIGHEHAHDGDPEQWSAGVALSEEQLRSAGCLRTVTPAQVEAYARQLLALVARHAAQPSTPPVEPKAGDRLDQGDGPGTLIRCRACSGDGLLLQLDNPPPRGPEPLDPDPPAEVRTEPGPALCRSCGRPESPTHDADAPGPTVRHIFIPAAPAVPPEATDG